MISYFGFAQHDKHSRLKFIVYDSLCSLLFATRFHYIIVIFADLWNLYRSYYPYTSSRCPSHHAQTDKNVVMSLSILPTITPSTKILAPHFVRAIAAESQPAMPIRCICPNKNPNTIFTITSNIHSTMPTITLDPYGTLRYWVDPFRIGVVCPDGTSNVTCYTM